MKIKITTISHSNSQITPISVLRLCDRGKGEMNVDEK